MSTLSPSSGCSVEAEVIDAALGRAREALLAERTAAGHWEGHLSSSALSTATAAFALWKWGSEGSGEEGTETLSPQSAIAPALRWLIEHQNADGGWGDTVDSLSNISTTALCWAALRAIAPRLSAAEIDQDGANGAIARADEWLIKAAGALEPKPLSEAIIRRYGKDRTFSVPILTMSALAGVLGPDPWKRIPQLPFELAAFPQSWFRFLKLPVVSYALPALIAMGQVRHHHRPTGNPVARLVRWLVKAKTLKVLRKIQPRGGGFLEAAPLTSFVLMSLAGAGLADHPVAKEAAQFLLRTVRADGSWPIDTNLATWVTTLSVNCGLRIADCGLGKLREVRSEKREEESHCGLGSAERESVRRWLLNQQYRVRHPYTGADPGGWAWTDLPGGVPDADDTAGALLALHHLGEIDAKIIDAACAGIGWLLGLQNSDGGIPTFCRGWGTLPFDKSAAELTAHALLAWHTWRDRVPEKLAKRIDRATERAIRSLGPQQRADGSWAPLWFGNQRAPEQENPTHGTSRVVVALCTLLRPVGKLGHSTGAMSTRAASALSNEAEASGSCGHVSLAVPGVTMPTRANTGAESPEIVWGSCGHGTGQAAILMLSRALRFLLGAQNADGGWGGGPGIDSSIEETSQAMQAVATARDLCRPTPGENPQFTPLPESIVRQIPGALARATRWLLDATDHGRRFPASPIGLYFAKLWYFERLYPIIATVGALERVKSAGS